MYENIFVVDVEATSATPMTGVMTEFGIVHAATMRTFYGHLYDFSPHPDIPALPVVDRDAAGNPVQNLFSVAYGEHVTHDSIRHLALAAQTWVGLTTSKRPTLVSDNNGFDAMWFNCFTDAAGIGTIFGHSSRRIGDFYAGTKGRWNDQSSWKRLRKTSHTHHPVDDALGNAEALKAILDSR